MTSSTFLSTNHVRAYHVTLSCGLHGADDVVHAGEQKVKLFVVIRGIHLETQSGTQFLSSQIRSAEPFERFAPILSSRLELNRPCNLDMAI